MVMGWQDSHDNEGEGHVHPRGAIEKLRTFLFSEVSEHRLLATIDSTLQQLRNAYLKDKQQFTDADIGFLQRAGEVRCILESFIDAIDDLEDIYGQSDYLAAFKRLSTIKAGLDGMPVSGRVAKEMRELQERLPELHKREAIEELAKLERIKKRISSDAPKCSRRHTMVLREFPRYFWGCSNYPWCTETRQLSEKHREMLEGG